MAQPPNLAERSIAISLRALNRVASSQAIDRLGLREPTVRLVHTVTRNGARTATTAGRTFAAAQRLGRPVRQPRAAGDRRPDLFDLTPDDEQELLRGSVRAFAMEQLRPVAADADAACTAPPALLAQANELGLTMVGVPEQLGGVVARRSATTTVLMAEALARGDMGIAVACLAPAAVSTALSLWGDADQQSTYLPPFVSDDVPAASLALMEPQPLFDPFALRSTARRTDDGYVLDGVKALVPRAADAELFVIAARLADSDAADSDPARPSLFIVESGTPGLSVSADPGMGVRAAAGARLKLEGVTLPSTALLGDRDRDRDRETYSECVALSRLAWCALALGTGQAVLEYVTDYVKSRQAFGEPISNRQAVAFAVANIAIELEGLRLATYRAASRVDQGLPFTREVALARRLATDKAMTIGSDGVQLLGGHGFTTEHPVERWYRDLRAAGIMEGGLLV